MGLKPLTYIILSIPLIVIFRLSEHSFFTASLQTRSTYCPTPWERPLTSIAPIVCEGIESNHSQFNIELCYDPQRCNAGHIIITYLNPTECSRIETDENASLDIVQNEWVKSTLGPHTITVVFDGAARAGGESKVIYEGGCRYKFPFQLNNGGRFQYRIVLLYTEYQGLDSLNQDKWQPILSIPLLSTPALSPLGACSENCKRYLAADYDPSLLPLCSREQAIDGTWLPNFPSLPYNATAIADPNPVLYGRFPNYSWIPAQSCQLSTLALSPSSPWSNRTTCFGKKRKILITGDSHLNWMRDNLFDQLARTYESVLPGEKHRYNKTGSGDWYEIGALGVAWKNDVVLSHFRDNLLTTHFYEGFDVVFMSAVQWLVHQPIAEYRLHIQDLASKISQFHLSQDEKGERRTDFIWSTSPAWPHRSDATVIRESDTRTNPRLSQMNQIATSIFISRKWMIVDNFSWTEMFAVGGESRDLAHWFGTPVIDIMGILLVHRLNLCQ